MAGLIRAIQERLRRFPEVSQWPELLSLVERETLSARPCWEFTLDACEVVGGSRHDAEAGASVVFCMLYSIHLVDDLLDDDPKGIYHQVGRAAAANMALAFQSVAGRLLGECHLEAEAERFAHRRLAAACLGTAFGQMLDSHDFEGEEAYWRMVRLKTPPLFSFALFLGALIGGATVNRAEAVASLGERLGEIIQISDDLHDALAKPAAPDWQRKATNLPILYAATADHAERQAFLNLVPEVANDEALERAQDILVRSGAFSYCAYRLVQAYRQARQQIDDLSLPRSEVMIDLFDHYIRPLRRLLQAVGVEVSDALFEGRDA